MRNTIRRRIPKPLQTTANSSPTNAPSDLNSPNQKMNHSSLHPNFDTRHAVGRPDHHDYSAIRVEATEAASPEEEVGPNT